MQSIRSQKYGIEKNVYSKGFSIRYVEQVYDFKTMHRALTKTGLLKRWQCFVLLLYGSTVWFCEFNVLYSEFQFIKLQKCLNSLNYSVFTIGDSKLKTLLTSYELDFTPYLIKSIANSMYLGMLFFRNFWGFPNSSGPGCNLSFGNCFLPGIFFRE